MGDAILTLNAGSSSLKFAVFGIGPDRLDSLVRGQIEGIGTAPHLLARDRAGATVADQHPDGAGTYEALLGLLLDWVNAHLGDDRLVAAGHRVVHGGPALDRPARVDDDLLRTLDRLVPMAPLHQPHNLSPIRAVAAARPGLAQVACFDTSFHHAMPAVAARLGLPRRYAADGLRRYGFHGLSYEYIARWLREHAPELAAGRVIVAHLGNGASLCALHAGRSVDTTMGFTPLDGLLMGTRSGTIDPGAVLYLQRTHGMDAEAMELLLYQQSGLLGVSGISSDMRVLLASPAMEARQAVELFVFRVAREAGGLASSLGGIDGLVFTGGIGASQATIRDQVCQRLAWLGATLDAGLNARIEGAGRISTPDSRVAIWALPTDEEATIARHTLDMIAPRAAVCPSRAAS